MKFNERFPLPTKLPTQRRGLLPADLSRGISGRSPGAGRMAHPVGCAQGGPHPLRLLGPKESRASEQPAESSQALAERGVSPSSATSSGRLRFGGLGQGSPGPLLCRNGKGPAWAARPLVLIIRFYRALRQAVGVVSPIGFIPPSCRFWPTCSSYAERALGLHGLKKGAQLSLARLLKCHPFHPGGWDPVPNPSRSS